MIFTHKLWISRGIAGQQPGNDLQLCRRCDYCFTIIGEKLVLENYYDPGFHLHII